MRLGPPNVSEHFWTKGIDEAAQARSNAEVQTIDISRAAESLAGMVADWYGNNPLPNARITADVIAQRLARFATSIEVTPSLLAIVREAAGAFDILADECEVERDLGATGIWRKKAEKARAAIAKATAQPQSERATLNEIALEDAAKSAFVKAQSVYRADHDNFPLKSTWETTSESIREGWRSIAYAALEAAYMPPLGTQPEPRQPRRLNPSTCSADQLRST